MQFASVEAFPLAIPLRHPMRLASETIYNAQTLLVRVVDREGREGWGEASSAPTMTGDLLPGMFAAVTDFIGPALCTAPLDDLALATSRISRAIRGNTGAKAAVEIALLDLFARRAGVPVASLLGTPLRSTAPAILMLAEQGSQAILDAARVGIAAGTTHLKLKVGLAPHPVFEATIINGLRAALGPAVHLSADANMAWTVEAALAFAKALAPDALNYLEQPVTDDDLKGMAAVAAAMPCPLCFDEGLHGLRDITAHAEAKAAGGVGLKAIKLGGLQATLAADALARRHGLRTSWACKIAESSVGAASVLHAAAVLPEVEWGVSVTHRYLAEDLVATPVEIIAGQALLPAGPGLGVAPLMDRVARYCTTGPLR